MQSTVQSEHLVERIAPSCPWAFTLASNCGELRRECAQPRFLKALGRDDTFASAASRI